MYDLSDPRSALAKSAADITLADVYRAVLPARKMFLQRAEIPHRCVVSSNIEEFLGRLGAEAEDAVLASLGTRSLQASLDEMGRQTRQTARRMSRRRRV